MKTKRIYREFFNSMLAHDFNLRFWEIDDNTICVTDGYRGYIVPKRDFPLNLDMLKKADAPFNVMSQEGYSQLKYTTELRDIGNKGLAVKFAANDLEVWLNKKYVDLFDEPTVWATAHDKACLISKMGEPVGVILPIRINREA